MWHELDEDEKELYYAMARLKAGEEEEGMEDEENPTDSQRMHYDSFNTLMGMSSLEEAISQEQLEELLRAELGLGPNEHIPGYTRYEKLFREDLLESILVEDEGLHFQCL